MAGILTVTGIIDPTLVAAVSSSHECAYCRSLIVSGERWVREKIYAPYTEDGPHYRRYHADLFRDEGLSCWEKHEMELEIARIARTADRIM
ncbi:MAG TPA: hypothetical protein VMJ35_03520 [Dongiaceae bacterium]|nr:hypothetical protein [Dongiaceae bacterium]